MSATTDIVERLRRLAHALNWGVAERIAAEAADEIESLRKDLLTAHLMVAKDAHDSPGRMTSAIRPFLAGAVERHGLGSGRSDQ